MRVLFLQQQPCVRALKYAVGLDAIRPDIRLGFAYRGLSLTELYGTGDELFDGLWPLGDSPVGGLRRAIAEFSPDLVHSHNLPDALTVLALEVTRGRIPVIHDVHDLQSLRRTPYEDGFPEPADPLALEKRAVEGCAAVVTVSQELLAEIGARHRLPARTLAFGNYALARDLPELPPAPGTRRAGAPRLVYQGTLSTNGGHYDLRDLFAAVVAGGAELDVFPARAAPEYHALAAACPGLRCHPTLTPAALMRALPAYDFGWAGFNSALNGAHLDTVLPNKAYEYLGCGLPVVTLEHRALARLVRERGVGVSVTRLDDLAGQLARLDVPMLKARIAATRLELTIEANVQRVAALYETVVARRHGARRPPPVAESA